MKSHLKDFATVGLKPIVLMVSETAFPAILVARSLSWPDEALFPLLLKFSTP